MSKNVIIVGLGGIGSHLLRTLLMYINSREDREEFVITLADGDKYEENNANRQDFIAAMVGMNKADAQRLRCSKNYPKLNIAVVDTFIGPKNVAEIIPEGSVVLSCVDNNFCRAVLSKRVQELNNGVLISGGNELEDGNVQVFERHNGVNLGMTIEERHLEILEDTTGDRSEMSCEELSNLPSGGQVMFANNAAATIMGNLFYTHFNGKEIGNITDIYFDINGSRQARIIDGIPE
jgi:molybdopterin/thiamine biosynthesis adenylyltransferase